MSVGVYSAPAKKPCRLFWLLVGGEMMKEAARSVINRRAFEAEDQSHGPDEPMTNSNGGPPRSGIRLSDFIEKPAMAPKPVATFGDIAKARKARHNRSR